MTSSFYEIGRHSHSTLVRVVEQGEALVIHELYDGEVRAMLRSDWKDGLREGWIRECSPPVLRLSWEETGALIDKVVRESQCFVEAASCIVAPKWGALTLVNAIAHHYPTETHKILLLEPDFTTGDLPFEPGERVLFVDDIIDTGTTLSKILALGQEVFVAALLWKKKYNLSQHPYVIGSEVVWDVWVDFPWEPKSQGKKEEKKEVAHEHEQT